MSHLVFEFDAAVRGYHVYREIWRPTEGDIQRCFWEEGNNFDIFAIKVINESNDIIGHLPREISRPTKFLIDRGASITAKITSTTIRRSPLFQGGLEILCKVTIMYPKTIKGKLVMDRYEEMVHNLYHEPQNPVIVGTIGDRSEDINWRSMVVTKQKKKKKQDKIQHSKKPKMTILSYFVKK